MTDAPRIGANVPEAFPNISWFECLGEMVASDLEMRVLGRYFEARFAIVCGGRTILVEIEPGLPFRAVEEPGMEASWDFTLRGEAADWESFLSPVPPALCSDPLAMDRHIGTFHIEGDRKTLVRHMRGFHRLFQLARRIGHAPEGKSLDPETALEKPDLSGISGRYVRLAFDGSASDVYFEEAGIGAPLLCLHTAGSDSRQYRHLMCDEEVTSNWRVIAFDMPAHGRSSPPDGWWKREYRLTTETYASTVMAFVDALGLKQPMVLGCSMGGAVALELARDHPEEIGCAISLEAASKVEGRFLDWSILPDAGGSATAAAWIYGLMAPQSPERHRREVFWHYAQGGPGVYRGDTFFYGVDWDMRGKEEEIDTKKCPVYMMTGEYDHACTPAESRETARKIPGAEFTEMKGLGHFPMAENYSLFREYLAPILERIAEART